jgi:hypothetical protein
MKRLAVFGALVAVAAAVRSTSVDMAVVLCLLVIGVVEAEHRRG